MAKIENSQLGDDDHLPSIEEICNTTWEPIYRFIYYKVQNREEAEDITQETYIKAMSHLQSGKVNPSKYIGFLKTVALNVLRDLWRKKKRRGTAVNIELINQMDDTAEDPAEMSAQRHLIENALSKLNKEQRTVIELRILKGYSVAETARLMNKKEVTIRVMQHRALQMLADILK
ncbi:RNA polymerase sigma factor [Virgibacillus ndiopensis]|uniref:RNA polymerase sigma factor n=1 Tax=Virgibacillus ndiopensis TaxID=2004408 RepID=UPI000C0841A1|nr:sigma-70 family RNA polymerase sigma factor [Virgibacillus ndiopensis]